MNATTAVSMKPTAKKNNPGPISKDSLIMDIAEKYPEAVPIIMSYGLHCVGCGASGMEALGQGAAGHGMSEEDIDSMVKDINDAIKEANNGAPIKLTTRAASTLVEVMNQEGHKVLRVVAKVGGNAGMTYDMQLEEKAGKDDIVFEHRGITMCTDKESMTLLKGAVIDFLDTPEGGGFKVTNPNLQKAH